MFYSGLGAPPTPPTTHPIPPPKPPLTCHPTPPPISPPNPHLTPPSTRPNPPPTLPSKNPPTPPPTHSTLQPVLILAPSQSLESHDLPQPEVPPVVRTGDPEEMVLLLL